MRYLARIVLLLLALAVVPAGRAPAQDPPAPQATTAQEPGVDLEILELRLRPLLADEVAAEADAWRDLLKAKVAEISAARVRLRAEGLPEAERDQLTARVPDLVEERRRLLDRMAVVLADWKRKGGETDAMQAWVDAVAGTFEVDAADPNALLTAVTKWVTSPEGGIRWGLNILQFVVLLVAFKFLSMVLGRVTRSAVARLPRASDLLRHFIVRMVQRTVMVIGVIVALSSLEIDITPLLAAIGAAGLVIGLALQGTLSNFAAGVLILIYRPYDVGDWVSAAGVAGTVQSMNLLSTTVKSADNQVIIVPNGAIWGGVITNVTGSDTRRIDLVFGIGYGDDIAKAQQVLEGILRDHELVLDDPAPVVKVHKLGESSVDFVVRPWVKTSDYWGVYWDVTRAVKERFDAEGISIPFPQRDVHLHQVAAAT